MRRSASSLELVQPKWTRHTSSLSGAWRTINSTNCPQENPLATGVMTKDGRFSHVLGTRYCSFGSLIVLPPINVWHQTYGEPIGQDRGIPPRRHGAYPRTSQQ